jgi:hypothetical protein
MASGGQLTGLTPGLPSGLESREKARPAWLLLCQLGCTENEGVGPRKEKGRTRTGPAAENRPKGTVGF